MERKRNFKNQDYTGGSYCTQTLSCKQTQHRRSASRKRRMRSRIHLLCGLFILLTIFSAFSLGSFLSSAQGSRSEEPVSFEYYKNIQVRDGDTLHGLAKQYNTGSRYSDNEYVKEIKKLNNMKSSCLLPGESLIIMYYDTEYK